MEKEYLARIQTRPPARADAEALAELQFRHLMAVPFENLDIHLKAPIRLDHTSLFDKIVNRRRGGFCYELNGLFADLLTALGYEVTLLAARAKAPFDHLALRVNDIWLVDVGFGRFARRPIRLDVRGEQSDDEGKFQVVEAEHGDLDVFLNGELEYRVELRPRSLADFEIASWWQQTSPESHFTKSPICSLPTLDGRITLTGNKLIRTSGDRRYEQVIEDEAELKATYTNLFGMSPFC